MVVVVQAFGRKCNNEKRVRVLVDEGKKYIEFCNEDQALIHLTKFYKEFGKENPLWSSPQV